MSVRSQEKHPCCRTGSSPKTHSSLYPIEETSLLGNPEQSRICTCNLLDHTRAHTGRESSRSPALPGVTDTWHSINSPCLALSPELLQQLLLSLPRSPPGDSRMYCLPRGMCCSTNYSKLREMKENTWGSRAMVCVQAQEGWQSWEHTGDLHVSSQGTQLHPANQPLPAPLSTTSGTSCVMIGFGKSCSKRLPKQNYSWWTAFPKLHQIPSLGNLQSYTWVYRHI